MVIDALADHGANRPADSNSPILKQSSAVEMASREQRTREMEFSLSHTNPLFNQPSSPNASCHCRRWSLSQLEDTGTFTKASSSSTQHKENWTSEHHENTKQNDAYSLSSRCIKLSQTPLKQRVLSERLEFLNSAVMQLESKTEDSTDEHRGLSPEISKAELIRRKRILEDRVASPRTEEKATKALSHVKYAPFTSPSPQSARGKRRRSTGHMSEELPRTHGFTGKNKVTDPRPYDPKQNFLSPRPQFLRYRPNRQLDLLQRSETADAEVYAALKVGDLNQPGNQDITAAVVRVGNLEDNGVVVPETCNSSFLVAAGNPLSSPSPNSIAPGILVEVGECENEMPGPFDNIEVGIENISAEEDRDIKEVTNMPQSEELGSRVPAATEAIIDNGTKEDNACIQEAILPQSEDLGRGVGATEAISENVTKEDNPGSQEAIMLPSDVTAEADIGSPEGLLPPPNVSTNSEAVKENLDENGTNVEDRVDAPTMEVTSKKTVTDLSVQKEKTKMVVRFLAVFLLVAVCMVGVTFFGCSSSSAPVRTSSANFLVEPWQNLSASKPITNFLDFNLLSADYKEPLQTKTGKLGNMESCTGVSSQFLVDGYKLFGSNLPNSFRPNVIVERSEAAFVEPLPSSPTSLSATEASGCFQQGQGEMHELVDRLTEEYMMQDEAALDIINNNIEYDFDAGLSTEPEDRNQEDTECAMAMGRTATVMREDALPTVSNPGSHVQSPEEETSLEQTLTETTQKESVGDKESIVGSTINPFMSLGDFEGGMCSLPSVQQSQLSKFPAVVLVGMAAAAVAVTLAITLRFMKSAKKSMLATRMSTKGEQVMYDTPQAPSTPGFKPKSATETRRVHNSSHPPAITTALKPNTENLMPIYEHKRTSKSSSRSSPRRALAQPVLRATPATNSTPQQAHLSKTPVRSAPVGYFSPTCHTPVTSYTPSASSSYMPSESTTSSTSSGSRETWSVADSELSGLLDDSQLGSFTAYEPILSSEGLEMERLKLTPVRRSLRIRNQVAASSPLAARKVGF